MVSTLLSTKVTSATFRPIQAKSFNITNFTRVTSNLKTQRSANTFKTIIYASSTEEPDISESIKKANEACAEGDEAACATAWDEVEELSAAAAHKRNAEVKKDPLEEYCEEAPEADECRVYED